MAELRFAGVGGNPDRRRRLLMNEVNSDVDAGIGTADEQSTLITANAAFPLLSRDRMIRRLISPRLWKHVVLNCGLIGLPLTLAALWCSSTEIAASNVVSLVGVAGSASMMRGLSGLELFLSAQMCLLICWVRAASAVDFRGGFRTWRWMAVLLLAASLLLLTGASSILMHGLAALLQPLMGTLEAAKPALLVVPAGACLAFVLRYLIPDMGRCRAAQAMLVFAVVIMIGRVIFGLRTTFSVEAPVLAILDLLTSGLVLSAFQLHCRYVIHVNPNPPTAVKRILRAVKPAATPSLESPTGEVGGLITAMPPVEAVNVVSVPVAATEINIVKQQPEQKCSGHDPVMETRQPDHRTEGLSSGKDRGRGKLSKKQLRRAG